MQSVLDLCMMKCKSLCYSPNFIGIGKGIGTSGKINIIIMWVAGRVASSSPSAKCSLIIIDNF